MLGMKVITRLVFTLLFAAGFRGEEASVSNVLELTADNFKSTIEENKVIMVEFFAPWCGHCKKLAPHYDKAAAELTNTSIKLAKVDCTVHKSICEENGVRGFPTLKVFNEGVATDYESERDSDAIVSYMKKQLLPTVSEPTAENFEEFLASDKVVMIGYFKDTESEEARVFTELAKKYRNEFLFGRVSDEKLAKEHGASFPGVVLYKKFDEGKDIYTGDFNLDELTEFLKTSSVPLLDDISPDNFRKYMDSKLPLAYIFVESEEERNAYDASLKDLAKKVKGKVNMVFINATSYGRHAESLNLKLEFPTFGIQEFEPNGKFPIDQSSLLSSEAIIKHVEAFVAGTLEPSIKSEPIPEDNSGPVTVIVGKTFSEIAYDKTKDVLVEFYASWCGHCKKLGKAFAHLLIFEAPIYAELGEAYKNNDKIVIAKMEVIENDLPYKAEFEVSGFPTIKLFKANTNEIVEYEGDRTVEGFVEFLKENAFNDATADLQEAEDEESDDDKDEL